MFRKNSSSDTELNYTTIDHIFYLKYRIDADDRKHL